MTARTRAPITRRDFLVGASAAAGAIVLAPITRFEDEAHAAAVRPLAREDIDAFILSQMRSARLPSLSTEVVAGTQVVRSKAYGTADFEKGIDATPDTVYVLASISKTVVCAAFMQLWEAGSVDLDADIKRYLPFEVRSPNHPKVRITPRMLLTHTSSILDRWFWGTPTDLEPYGFTQGDSPVSLRDILAAYFVPGGDLYVAGENFATFPPGAEYEYCSLGVDLAALIVEVVSHKPFGEYCKEYLFTPLGMTDTGYHLADIATTNLAMPYAYPEGGVYIPYGHYGMADYPCAMLRTTATSLSRWLRCFMNYGELEGVRILERATVEEIFRPQVTDDWGGDQGLIWYTVWQGRETLLGHHGGNFGVQTAMLFAPDRGVGVILLGNQDLRWPPSAYPRFQAIQDRLFDQA